MVLLAIIISSPYPKILQNSDYKGFLLLSIIEVVLLFGFVYILYFSLRNKRNAPQKIDELKDKKTYFLSNKIEKK